MRGMLKGLLLYRVEELSATVQKIPKAASIETHKRGSRYPGDNLTNPVPPLLLLRNSLMYLHVFFHTASQKLSVEVWKQKISNVLGIAEVAHSLLLMV